MQQILFEIPTPWGTFPIFGYGFMLFLAFVFSTLLAARMAKRQGIKPEYVQDLAIWIFVCGIVGGRLAYITQPQYAKQFGSIIQFFRIWEGGLVLYGGVIGGIVGFLGAYYFILRKHNISSWKMLDIIAPCAALGLAIGRFGCLLNGCCYGGVACPPNPGIVFPMPSAPRDQLTTSGYQTAAGFTVNVREPRFVEKVIPGSPAEKAGLEEGDAILEVNGNAISPIDPFASLETAFSIGKNGQWPRGKNTIILKVSRKNGQIKSLTFTPYTIPLHPTQIYESISCGLLFLLLFAYYPLRRNDGEVVVLLLLGYSVHRFLNELLRNDTPPFPPFGLTYSGNISLVVFVAAIGLGVFLRLQPPQYGPNAKAAPTTEPEKPEAEEKPTESETPKKKSKKAESKKDVEKPSTTSLQD